MNSDFRAPPLCIWLEFLSGSLKVFAPIVYCSTMRATVVQEMISETTLGFISIAVR